MGYKNITIECNLAEYLNGEKRKCLLVYDDVLQNSLMTQITNKHIIKEPISYIGKNYNSYINIIGIYQDCKYVYGMGGGAAIDIAKYIAKLLNIPYATIPTVLSNNSFATNKGVLLKDGGEVTIDCDNPDHILFDRQFLTTMGKFNNLGYADILAMETALFDWKLAAQYNNESIDQHMLNIANNTLKQTKEYIANNPNNLNNIDLLYNDLGITGDLTIDIGCGRVCSGVEHIFAKKLETIISVPHGIAVGIGILIGLTLQDRPTAELLQLLHSLQYFNQLPKLGITKELIIDVTNGLAARTDRYTILNKINISDYAGMINKIIDEIFDIC